MYYRTKNIIRLVSIFRTLAKYDCLSFIEGTSAFGFLSFFAKIIAPVKIDDVEKYRKGQLLSMAFEELGPTFIKLGQALSIRSDLVGVDVADDLANLRDSLPPFESDVAVRIIEEEFETEIKNIFPEFDLTPIAAASIAQVHFAVDRKGNHVAVKILRPDIEEKFRKDLDLLFWVAKIIDHRVPKYRRLKLQEVVQIFAESTKYEMDFTYEAAAASELRHNFKDDGDIRVPQVYWDLTSTKVLTIERFYGIRIDDREALIGAGLEPDDILRKSADIFLKQSLRDGFFHADMHPGNVLVDKNGRICVFDFGIVGRISQKTRIFLAEMLIGFLNRDYQKVADVHFEAGYIGKHHSRELFAQACRSIGEPIFDLPQNEISVAKLLQKLFQVTEDFEMETQPQLLLLQKTMMMAEGIGRILNPNVNFWNISRDLIEDWGKQNLGPKAKIEYKIKETVESIDKLNNIIDNYDRIITPKGAMIHPDIIKEITKQNNNNSFYKGIIYGFILFVTFFFLYELLK